MPHTTVYRYTVGTTGQSNIIDSLLSDLRDTISSPRLSEIRYTRCRQTEPAGLDSRLGKPRGSLSRAAHYAERLVATRHAAMSTRLAHGPQRRLAPGALVPNPYATGSISVSIGPNSPSEGSRSCTIDHHCRQKRPKRGFLPHGRLSWAAERARSHTKSRNGTRPVVDHRPSDLHRYNQHAGRVRYDGFRAGA